MITSEKTVLLFQPSKFPAKVWHYLLSQYQIKVIWEENYDHKKGYQLGSISNYGINYKNYINDYFSKL